MTLGHGAWMACDDCGAHAVSNHSKIATFKALLVRQGWSMVDPGYHFCPTCTQRRTDSPNGPWFPPDASTRIHPLTDNWVTQGASQKAANP